MYSRFSGHTASRFRGSSRGRFNRGGPRSGYNPFSKYVSKGANEEAPVAAPIITNAFTDFVLEEKLKANIAARGYTTPTPIQDQVIPHVLEGRDVVGIANTGTGKTAAFLIPLINKIIRDESQKALIMVPTRELAVQIRDELRALTPQLFIRTTLCIGGAHMGSQLRELRNRPQIVISTPGRLLDLVKRRALYLEDFKTIVLDEVDRMVDIGFIRDIRFVISMLPPVRQSLFFSATVSAEINQIIQTFLKDPVTVSVKTGETARNIEQDIIRVTHKSEKIEKLHSMLSQEEFSKVLIFGRTKWEVEKLSRYLQDSGFDADAIHGNKSQNQRLRVLQQFKQNRLKVLVATDVAARGLDIDDISHVINYDEPATYDDYVHRIGRTGRGEKQGKALTFVG